MGDEATKRVTAGMKREENGNSKGFSKLESYINEFGA
jgi:hypothetical protein